MNITSQNHQVVTSQVVTSQHGKHVGMTTQQQVLTQQSLAPKTIQQLTAQDIQSLAQQNIQVVSSHNQGQQLSFTKTTSSLKSPLLSPQSAVQQTCQVTIVPSETNQPIVMSSQQTPTVSPNKQVSQQSVTQQISQQSVAQQISQQSVAQQISQQSVAQQISQIPNLTPEVIAELHRITANQQTVISTQQTPQQASNQRPLLPAPQTSHLINVSQQSDKNSESDAMSVIGKEDTINNQQWIEICPDNSA